MTTSRNLIEALTASALLAWTPAGLFAQWPAYPTPGVPKTADGKPNLSGTHAEGRGWPSGSLRNGLAGSAPGGRERPRRAKPASVKPGCVRGATILFRCPSGHSQFWNLGASFKDGLPFQPWAAELHRQRVASNSNDNPDAHCLPLGVMQLHTHGQPRKMVQTPGLIVIIYEANAGLRQIFTDGRPCPRIAEPWWYGYSIGKWEGDTLVVESTGLPRSRLA